MSYVSVYENKTPRAKGVLLAGAVHAAIIGGVIAMPGIEVPEKFNGPFNAIPIVKPEPSDPVIIEDPPRPDLPQEDHSRAPDMPIADVRSIPIQPFPTYSDLGNALGSSGTAAGIPLDPIQIAPDPVIVGARLNSRYADQFQPAYPPGQLRLEREAEVSVRVLVGTDGRVKQIELIDSPHQDFWLATRKQALSKWRFTPATKDGKPFESWMTLKVRFEINS
ncbi:MAG: TonB family protein [Sphingomonadales bacterium]|nr:TonB family protein [Sphingomonadales bacterium]NCO50010.1 TonB family protein [Sphingomonadales bacterium]NCP00473.1 TonB family protein [Sphingomonadales bacterium]NCP43403.1 TonB family protein [Sphingomonadales bacterium]NCP50032.1 TonB family protein [Sphingomonadales bacterium]